MAAKTPIKISAKLWAIIVVIFSTSIVTGTIALQRHYFPETVDSSTAIMKANELLKAMPPDSAVDNPAVNPVVKPSDSTAWHDKPPAPSYNSASYNAASFAQVDTNVRPVVAQEKESGFGTTVRIMVTPPAGDDGLPANDGLAVGPRGQASLEAPTANQPRAIAAGNEPRPLPASMTRPQAGNLSNTLAMVEPLELMRQLRGDDVEQQKIARAELTRRGFNQVDFELSKQLLDSDVDVRKRLAVTVPRLASVDPVPWLLWLSQDPEPSVRYVALSTLGTTGDPSLLQRVEQLVRNDHDPQVQALAKQIDRQLDAVSNRGGPR